MNRKDYNRVYVWQLSVRIFHWVNTLAVILLAATGYLIAKPPAILLSAEATHVYWFGFIRAIHFISAYVFIAVLLWRLYIAFFGGNKYANWRAFFPFKKAGRRKIKHVMTHDILLINYDEEDYSKISIGHNPFAAISYLVMFLLALAMIFTGFGLFADNATWWLPKMFGWVPEFLGGDFAARKVHHFLMWIFLAFIVIHVYLVLFHDWLEGRGETSSMISGYKYVRKERLKEIEKEQPEEIDVEA